MFNSSHLSAVDIEGRRTLPCSIAATTHIGGRTENEDCHRILHLRGRHLFAIVADGLGGHAGGALASARATSAIVAQLHEHAGDEFNYVELVQRANAAVVDERRQASGASRMRTTLVLLHLDLLRATAFWLHCGDSRLLHIRDGRVEHRTLDHSVAQMLVADGELNREDIRHHPDRNRLLRSLGGSPEESRPRLVASAIELSGAWGFMLCTDGWWELLSEQQIAAHHKIGAQQWVSELEALVLAGQTSRSDNATAIGVSSLCLPASD